MKKIILVLLAILYVGKGGWETGQRLITYK